ncbi:MAG: DUF308 domain-containing protein [Lachnospiraceae bacterium]|jgi:uncharacterized membrane protein HdeD (DUF308 family)|nr:DUF308 domain-containing protein [Lachnospiraceae bacterium]
MNKETFRNILPMRTAKTGYIVLSLVLFLMGLFLLIFPKTVGNVFANVLGIAMILFGVIKVIGYFSKDLFRLAFQYDLAFGVLIILVGIATIHRPGELLEFLCMVIGVLILADGLFKIQMSMDAKVFGIHKWWLILSLAVIAGVFGALLLFNPTEGSLVIMRLIGVALMAEGIMNLATVLTAVKIIKHQKKDVLEGVYREL